MSQFDSQFETYARPAMLDRLGQAGHYSGVDIGGEPSAGEAATLIVGDEQISFSRESDGLYEVRSREITFSTQTGQAANPLTTHTIVLSGERWDMAQLLSNGGGMCTALFTRRRRLERSHAGHRIERPLT